jgi:hypothetical protein
LLKNLLSNYMKIQLKQAIRSNLFGGYQQQFKETVLSPHWLSLDNLQLEYSIIDTSGYTRVNDRVLLIRLTLFDLLGFFWMFEPVHCRHWWGCWCQHLPYPFESLSTFSRCLSSTLAWTLVSVMAPTLNPCFLHHQPSLDSCPSLYRPHPNIK